MAAVLSLRAGELGEEVFIYAAEDVLGAAFPVTEPDSADEVDQLAKAMLVQRGPGVILGQDALERVLAGLVLRLVRLLNRIHGIVHDLADGRLLGVRLEKRPTCFFRHPEDVFGPVFVRVFRIGPGIITFTRNEFGTVFLEAVGNVFEEDQPKDDMLVFRRVHVVPQLVGGEPEFGFEAERRTSVVGSGGFIGWLGDFFGWRHKPDNLSNSRDFDEKNP